MIRHIVLVKFAADTPDQDRVGILAELSGLQALVAGMRSFTGGPNCSPEGLGKGFTHGFVADFEDAAARDAYLVHPAHKAAGARLVRAVEGGLGGLVVVDIDMG